MIVVVLSVMINTIAGAMFGVYLIQDNFILRPYIWSEVFKNQEMYSSQFLIIYALCTIEVIFVICVIIDCLENTPLKKYL